ncbi:inositol monophosphatase family protein, partial [Klenkia sp. PcliD-1-E]|uniref:inositol monophosphatase family protein n=1 Tax=Klenkia sp. PcliD-1-E TaxID=2954492 RepID=UPI00209738CC
RPRARIVSMAGAADDPARLAADRVWVVDPLDGTKESRAGGRHDWAVHVALWERAADDLPAGAVGLPALGEVLSTDPAPVVPPAADRLRVAVSRSRPPEVARAAAAALDAVLVPLGSAGYKTLAVVRGEADAYVHAGGMFQWDSAAPVAVARAAGLWTSRLDGSPLVYNAPDTWLPDLVVCRPELADRVLAAVR